MTEDTAEVFRDALQEILVEYPTPDGIGEGTGFETAHSDHPLYQLVVNKAGDAIRDLIDTDTYEVKASVGRGSPTFIPYIAVMHRDETTSPQQGRYVVYLFDPIQRSLYLTLNQGATEAKERASESSLSSEDILRARAEEMAGDIDLDGFTNGRLDFEPPGEKSKLYGAGTVCYKEYTPDGFPDADTIVADLNRVLDIYTDALTESLQTRLEEHADTPSESGGNSLTEPSAYESLTEATQDIQRRLEQTTHTTNWLQEELGATIIEDWSNVLTGFQPSDSVPASEAAKLDQIRGLYDSAKDTLETQAAEIQSGTLDALSQTETLFLGLFRLLQDTHDIESGKLNQPRLNSIVNDTYTTTPKANGGGIPTGTVSNPDHPLVSQIQSGSPTVYKFTAPPDYWLTTYEYAALSFEEDDQEYWRDIGEGDVIVFHSRQSPSWDALDDQDSCLLGAGIVRSKTTKPDDEAWWYDEHEGGPKGDSFPYLVTFERLFLTGEFDKVDHSRDIAAKAPEAVNQDLDALTANALSFADANMICNDASDAGFPRHRVIATLGSPGDYDRALALTDALADRVREAPPVALHKPFSGRLSDSILEGLYFPDSQGEEILNQIEGALRSGKHVILTGPPGTGKTVIAQRVAETLADEYPYLYSGSQVTTATADWSTFDTVGGYMPNEDDTERGNHLAFTPGLVLNRFKTRHSNTQRNESLVIDELNRADIDKAFGQLFTVLSGQAVQLPYTHDGKEVELTPVDDRSLYDPHEYSIPDSWTLFATLNTYDKTSLYEMSYAFMRRFAFIRVPAPELTGRNDTSLQALLENYTDAWGLRVADFNVDSQSTNPLLDVATVWQAANSAIEDRAIGPAVVKDILSYLTETPTMDWSHRLTQAVISYILPQLEGVPKRDRVVRKLADVDPLDETLLDQASRDMLQVSAINDDE